jgi:TPR repeat protein
MVACARPKPIVSPAVITANTHLEADRVDRDLAAARSVLTRACDAADAAACAALADAMNDWLGFDPPGQTKLRQRACSLGHGGACAAAGRIADAERAEQSACAVDPAACWRWAQHLRARGNADAELVARARRLESQAWRRVVAACQAGDNRACRTGAALAIDSRPLIQDRVSARRILDISCGRGDARSCARALVVRVLRPTATGITALASACGEGDGTACEAWAKHASGEQQAEAATGACSRGLASGCSRDSERERSLLDRECELGRAEACDRLGTRRNDDVLIERACDLGRAESCYQRARDANVSATLRASLLDRGCARGHAASCRLFAHALHDGVGIKADPPRALTILTTHCATVSCRMAGVWLRTGDGVPEDPVRARSLLTAACRGDNQACGDLADMMLSGEGGPRAEVTAVALWRKLRDRLTEDCRAWSGEECVAAATLWRTRFGGLPVDETLAKELHQLCRSKQSCQ